MPFLYNAKGTVCACNLEQNPLWEYIAQLARTSHILWKPKLLIHIHKSSPLSPFLSQLNPDLHFSTLNWILHVAGISSSFIWWLLPLSRSPVHSVEPLTVQFRQSSCYCLSHMSNHSPYHTITFILQAGKRGWIPAAGAWWWWDECMGAAYKCTVWPPGVSWSFTFPDAPGFWRPQRWTEAQELLHSQEKVNIVFFPVLRL